MSGATTTVDTSSDIIEIVPAGTSAPVQPQQPHNGFCHSCNKNVHVLIETYVCSQCNGGFIELLANMDSNSSSSNNTGAQVPPGAQARPIDRLINPVVQLRDIGDRPEARSAAGTRSGGSLAERPSFVFVRSRDSSNSTTERDEVSAEI